MLQRGARCFLFMGRSGTDRPAARTLIEDLRAAGAQVQVERGDVSDPATVKTALRNAAGSIGGIVHAAMNQQVRPGPLLDFASCTHQFFGKGVFVCQHDTRAVAS